MQLELGAVEYIVVADSTKSAPNPYLIQLLWFRIMGGPGDRVVGFRAHALGFEIQFGTIRRIQWTRKRET